MVAGYEAVRRIIDPEPPTDVAVYALAGAIGFVGNWIAVLIADGNHARADAYVSLAVVASAICVALGTPIVDPIIGLAITAVILRITRDSWRTVRSDDSGHAH